MQKSQEVQDAVCKSRPYFNVVLFVCLSMTLLFLIQHVLIAKLKGPDDIENLTQIYDEFNELADRSDIQVLFLGASHIMEGVDPMLIYKLSGITSFILGSPGQPISATYHLLNDALNCCKPKLVVLDASRLFSRDFYDIEYRYVIDSMQFGKSKISFAKEYIKNFPEDQRYEAFIGALFPIYCYHDRWKELTTQDFRFRNDYNLFDKGQSIVSGIIPAWIDKETMNEYSEFLRQPNGWEAVNRDKLPMIYSQLQPLYAPKISSEAADWMLRMKKLCDENGIPLKLITIPTLGEPISYPASWTAVKSDMMKRFATENGVDFLDLFYDIELPIDWSIDTCDGGAHLNVLGAEKVSTYLADYFVSYCALQPNFCQAYEEDLPIYQKIMDVAALQTEIDAAKYIERLAQLDNAAVFMAANSSLIGALDEASLAELNVLGLKTDFAQVRPDAYVAVIENGQVCYEACSNWKTAASGDMDGWAWSLESNCWKIKPYASILLNGQEYAAGGSGLNIVVLDLDSGLILDSVSFYSLAGRWGRDLAAEERWLHALEEHLMRQDYARGMR